MAPRQETRPGRTWRGETAEQRRSKRRSKLIEAGIERFGTVGYANTTVKGICDEAGLTERYFYEAFDDRYDLLVAIYEVLIDDVKLAVAEAIATVPQTPRDQAEAGLVAFAHAVTADPRRARIQQLEVVGVSDALEHRRRDALHFFARLIADNGRTFGADGNRAKLDPDLMAMGLVGAVNELLIDFVLGNLDVDLDELVRHQVALFLAVAEALGG